MREMNISWRLLNIFKCSKVSKHNCFFYTWMKILCSDWYAWTLVNMDITRCFLISDAVPGLCWAYLSSFLYFFKRTYALFSWDRWLTWSLKTFLCLEKVLRCSCSMLYPFSQRSTVWSVSQHLIVSEQRVRPWTLHSSSCYVYQLWHHQ